MNSKWLRLLHSRTFGVIVVWFAFDTVAILGPKIPAAYMVLVNSALASIASYFHVNPPVVVPPTPVTTTIPPVVTQ